MKKEIFWIQNCWNMKYRTDLKIEYCHEKCSGSGSRYFYYRIKPSELPLWKRWFFNPWRRIYHAFSYMDGYNYLFNPREFRDELLPLKTFGDMCDYLRKHKAIIEERHWRKVQNGEKWPDDY